MAVQRLQMDTWARLWSTNVCLWKQMVAEMSPGGHWDRSKKGKEQGRRQAGLEKEVKKIKFKCLWAIITPENREQLDWHYLFYWLTFTVKLLQNETSFFSLMIWLNAGWTIGTWHISINNENIDHGWEYHRRWDVLPQ